MKGVRLTGSRHAELAELPIPSLRKGEVLIKVKVSAVCGSERIDYENGCGYGVFWKWPCTKARIEDC